MPAPNNPIYDILGKAMPHAEIDKMVYRINRIDPAKFDQIGRYVDQRDERNIVVVT